MISRLQLASAHGRFQPFHKGHLEYILAAAERADFLYVGLTQTTRSNLLDVSATAHHRAELLANPLTFFERHQLVVAVLEEAGLARDRFDVLPFPIEEAGVLNEFLPTDVPILTTIYDDWNREKVLTLRTQGYEVEVLWERDVKRYVGSEIRRLIALGDDDWKLMVPPATVRFVEQVDLHETLRALVQE